jgi:predicted membrane protein
MKTDPHRSLSGQILIGALVIGLGLLFLLDNLNVVDFHDAYRFWPVVFIVFGVARISDTRTPNGMITGGVLIVIGLMLTLRGLGFVYFSWRTIWPLLLMVVGAGVIYKAIAGRRERADTVVSMKEGDDAIVDVTAILGGFERRVTTPNFRGGEVTAIMGGCELDMRGSSIQGEAVLNVFAAMGGISIKVPPDWAVILHGTPILGGFEEKTIAPPDQSKRLVIKGYAIMGGVEVRN